MDLWNAMKRENSKVFTENGREAYSTSMDRLVDFVATIATMDRASELDIKNWVDELYEVGYQEYIDDDNSLLLIEWANNVPEVIEEASVVINLEYFDENSRYVNIKGIDLKI